MSAGVKWFHLGNICPAWLMWGPVCKREMAFFYVPLFFLWLVLFCNAFQSNDGCSSSEKNMKRRLWKPWLPKYPYKQCQKKKKKRSCEPTELSLLVKSLRERWPYEGIYCLPAFLRVALSDLWPSPSLVLSSPEFLHSRSICSSSGRCSLFRRDSPHK